MLDRESGASRRSVLKGAAWTAPAVVVASAAPAYAVSGAAALTTVIEDAYNDTIDSVNVLAVLTKVTNLNTGAPGYTTVVFTVVPTSGAIVDEIPTILNVGASFIYVSHAPIPGGGFTYTFSNTTILGARDATSTEPKSFAWTVPVTGLSAGGINVTTTPTTGTSTPGVGRAWI